MFKTLGFITSDNEKDKMINKVQKCTLLMQLKGGIALMRSVSVLMDVSGDMSCVA